MGAAFHGLDGGFDGAFAGEDDDLAFEAVFFEFFKQLEAGHGGHGHIDHGDIEGRCFGGL